MTCAVAPTGCRFQASFTTALEDVTAFASVLRVRHADFGRLYALRIKAQGVAWQVVIDGGIGPEIYATGTIAPAATPQFVRPAVPDTLAGTEIRVEVKPVSSGELIGVELTWIPVQPGSQVQVWGPDGQPGCGGGQC